MSYRVLCDENVEPRTVAELEAQGHTARHVTTVPGQSSTDEEVAPFARRNDYVLLTNDDHFLDGTWSGVTVLYYPDNEASAHELAGRILELQEYYAGQEDLPETYYLTGTLE